MKIYGLLNDKIVGDVLANCVNATKTSNVGNGQHSCLQNSDQKRRLRTSMNKRRRFQLKRELTQELIDIEIDLQEDIKAFEEEMKRYQEDIYFEHSLQYNY